MQRLLRRLRRSLKKPRNPRNNCLSIKPREAAASLGFEITERLHGAEMYSYFR